MNTHQDREVLREFYSEQWFPMSFDNGINFLDIDVGLGELGAGQAMAWPMHYV